MKKLYHILFIVLLSSLFQSAFSQNRAFLNGGFESPVMDTATESQYFISANAPASYTDPRIKEWNTTASDYNVELRTYLPKTNKGEVSAIGNQHAEINATKVSRLYQNVCLINGETINYSFYHRGRKGYDDMEVNLYNAAGTSKITVLKNSGDDKVAWKQYSDLYFVNVPSGVYQFSFESVSQSGGASEGNLLDDISIGMAPLITFSKATYSAFENTVQVPGLKVNGTVPTGGLVVTLALNATSSAKEGDDFTLTKTITIPAGAYNATSDSFPVALNILDNTIIEQDETISISIQSITNGGFTGIGCGGSSATVYTILNDDVLDAGPDQVVCPSDSIFVNATGGRDPKWDKGVTQNIRFRAPLVAGDYIYTVRDTSYSANLTIQAFKDSLKITVKPAPAPVTKDIDTCQIAGNHTLIAFGTNLVWYNDSLPTTVGSSAAPIIDLNVPDTLSKWVSQVTNGCESERVKLRISIRVTPKAPAVKVIDTCQRAAIHTLTALGSNLKWYMAATGGTGNIVAPFFDLNIPDTTSRWVSQSVNGCEGPRSQLDIAIRVTPVAPTTKNIDTCQRVGTHFPTVAGSNLKWYTVAAGGIASTIAPSVNLNIPDTTIRWVSQSINGCEGPRSALDIAIKTTPLSPTTNNIDTCQRVGTHTLAVTGSNLSWYTVATGGTASSVTPTFNLNNPDTTSRWVSETLNGCEGPRSQIDIAIKVTPVAPTTKNIDTCQRVGTQTLSVAGTNLKWYTTATGGTASTVTPSFNLNIPDTTSRWVSQTLNGCEGPRSQLDIAIRTTPLVPVTQNIDTCQRIGTHTLSVAGTNLKWYTLATGGTANTVTPSFNLTFPDTTSRWVSQTLNGCEGPRSQVDIAIKKTPLAPIIKSIDTCQRVGTHILLVAGSNLKWYTVPTGGTASTTTPTFNLNIPDTTTRWVSQTLSSCEGPRSQIDIAIRKTPLPPTTKDIDTCQRSGTHTLLVTGNNLKWYTVAIGGTSSTTTPSFNLNIPDTINRWVSQTLNSCEGPRSQLNITIRATPTAPDTKNIDTCQRAGFYALTAIGSNLKWYTVATGGIGSTTAPSFDLDVLDTTSRWVSQTLNGCEGPRAQINIAVRLTLPAPLTRNIDTCQRIATHTLTATGSNLKWYTTATGGATSTLAPSFNLNIPDTTTRWVSQSANGCEGPRSQINIAIRTTPLAPVTTNIDTCQRVGMYTLTAIGTNLTWYTSVTATSGSSAAPSFNLNVPNIVNTWVSQTQNGCESPRSLVSVNTKPLPAAPLVKDTSLCQKTGTLSFKAIGSNLLWYAGGAAFGNVSTPSVNTNSVQTTTYSVSQTVNGCEGPKATEAIEIRSTPLAPTTNQQELCQAGGTVSFTAAGTNLKWYTSPTSTISTTITPMVNRNVAGDYLAYTSQTQNNCESPKQEARILINALPIAPNVTDAQYCLKDVAKPLTTLTDSLFWYTVAVGGIRSSLIPVPNTQATGVTNHWVSAVKKGCEGPRTAIIATVHALPVVKITGTLSGSYCSKSNLPLLGTGTTQYEWKLPSGNISKLANASIASFVAANQGKYVLKGIDANQCSAKDSVTLTLKNPPAVSANPVSVCEKAPVSIQAQTTGTAFWKLPGNRIQNSSRLSIPVSAYSDNGRYVVVSTQNGCTDSVELTITIANCKPTARDDFYSIYTDEKLVLDASNHPINNDSDPNDKLAFQDFTFLTTPQLGQLSSDANGFWTYKTNGDVGGKEVLEYQICDRGIPSMCTTAKVEIEIKKRDAFFPDAFTPNEDGINDTYTIYHLSSHIKVDLNVFNRWGDLVYQNSDYQNTWKGTCEASACLGSELPVGTYFVVAQLSNGYKHTTYLTLSR